MRASLRTITLAIGLVLIASIVTTVVLADSTRSAAEGSPPPSTTTTTVSSSQPLDIEIAGAIEAHALGVYLEGLAVQAYLDALHQADLAAQATQAARSGGVGGSCNGDVQCFLECTRAHESDTAGGYGAVSSSGTYRGAYQFQQSTWDAAVAGAGHAEYVGVPADQVPPEIQDAAAAHLYSVSGTRPWGGRC